MASYAKRYNDKKVMPYAASGQPGKEKISCVDLLVMRSSLPKSTSRETVVGTCYPVAVNLKRGWV